MATAYDTYDALREKGRVTRVKFGSDDDRKESQSPRDRFFNRETFFVTHYDDVVATLLDDRFSVDPRSGLTAEQREHDETPEEFRPFARSIISIDPPDHTRIRKLVQPSFTGRGMEAMRPSIQKTVDDLLDRAERDAEDRGETPGNRRMELVSQFAYPFPVTVISDLLGIPREDREQIRGWTENLLRVDRGRDEAMNEQVRQGLRDFTAYLKELFARKRREPTEDMISRMVLMEDDGDTLNEEETLATVFLMYLAGHVTTVNLVGNGVVALLTHPEQLAELKADPGLAKNVVEETLRYWGPVDFIGRRMATEDLEIAGTRSPPGIRSRSAWRVPIATPSASSLPRVSISAGRTPTATSPSARGSMSAWALRWPASRGRSPSRRWSGASQSCGWRCRRTRLSGAETSCAGSARCHCCSRVMGRWGEGHRVIGRKTTLSLLPRSPITSAPSGDTETDSVAQ